MKVLLKKYKGVVLKTPSYRKTKYLAVMLKSDVFGKSNDLCMKFWAMFLNFNIMYMVCKVIWFNCKDEAVDGPIEVDDEEVNCYIEENVVEIVNGSKVVEDDLVLMVALK